MNTQEPIRLLIYLVIVLVLIFAAVKIIQAIAYG